MVQLRNAMYVSALKYIFKLRSFLKFCTFLIVLILFCLKAYGALEEHRRMKDYLRRMEIEGVQRVKMFLVITTAYVLFWGPLFFVTLVNHPVVGTPLGHEVRTILYLS